jgi:hypothetical protein
LWAQTEYGTNYLLLIAANEGGEPAAIIADTAVSGPAATQTPLGEWFHYAIVRHDGDVTLYINGVGGDPVEITTDLDNETRDPTIAQYTHDSYGQFIGYIDDLRVTKGVARYTANFTPPLYQFFDE